MARLPPSRHTLHCRIRFLDRRAVLPSPLRTTFCCTALAICHSRRLPTQRRRRSDPSATSQTRSRPCDDASSSLSPRPSRDALVATPRSARHYESLLEHTRHVGGGGDEGILDHHRQRRHVTGEIFLLGPLARCPPPAVRVPLSPRSRGEGWGEGHSPIRGVFGH